MSRFNVPRGHSRPYRPYVNRSQNNDRQSLLRLPQGNQRGPSSQSHPSRPPNRGSYQQAWSDKGVDNAYEEEAYESNYEHYDQSYVGAGVGADSNSYSEHGYEDTGYSTENYEQYAECENNAQYAETQYQEPQYTDSYNDNSFVDHEQMSYEQEQDNYKGYDNESQHDYYDGNWNDSANVGRPTYDRGKGGTWRGARENLSSERGRGGFSYDRASGGLSSDRDSGGSSMDKGGGVFNSNMGRSGFSSDRGRGGFSSDRGRGSFSSDRGRGGFSSDRGRGSSSSDRGRGGSNTDQSRGGFSSDRGRGSSSSDRGRGGSTTDRGRGGFSSDRGRGGSSSDRGRGGSISGRGESSPDIGRVGSTSDRGRGGSSSDRGRGGSTSDRERGGSSSDIGRDGPSPGHGKGGSSLDRDRGGSNSDRGRGGSSSDRGRGGSSSDRGRGGSSSDRGRGGSSSDRGRGGSSSDRGRGGSSSDRGRGGSSSDRGRGGSSSDRGRGGSSSDRGRGGSSSDRGRGGSSLDRITYSASEKMGSIREENDGINDKRQFHGNEEMTIGSNDGGEVILITDEPDHELTDVNKSNTGPEKLKSKVDENTGGQSGLSKTSNDVNKPMTDKKDDAKQKSLVTEVDSDSSEEDTSYCKYCETSFTSAHTYHNHIRGFRHTQLVMAAEAKAKAEMKTEEIDDTPAPVKIESEKIDVKPSTSVEEVKPRIINDYDSDSSEEDTSYCKYCEVNFTSAKAYHNHTRGFRHTQLVMEAEAKKGNKHFQKEIVDASALVVHIPKPVEIVKEEPDDTLRKRDLKPDDIGKCPTDNFHCALCDINCTGAATFKTHIEGKQHKSKLEMAKQGVHPKKKKNQGETIIVETNDRKSKLMKSLASETAPIVGLEYITEFQKQDPTAASKFVCNLCESKCDISAIRPHLIGLKHRTKYFEAQDKEVFQSFISYNSKKKKSELAASIEQYAYDVEKRIGRANVKVKIEVDTGDDSTMLKEEMLKRSIEISKMVKGLTYETEEESSKSSNKSDDHYEPPSKKSRPEPHSRSEAMMYERDDYHRRDMYHPPPPPPPHVVPHRPHVAPPRPHVVPPRPRRPPIEYEDPYYRDMYHHHHHYPPPLPPPPPPPPEHYDDFRAIYRYEFDPYRMDDAMYERRMFEERRRLDDLMLERHRLDDPFAERRRIDDIMDRRRYLAELENDRFNDILERKRKLQYEDVDYLRLQRFADRDKGTRLTGINEEERLRLDSVLSRRQAIEDSIRHSPQPQSPDTRLSTLSSETTLQSTTMSIRQSEPQPPPPSASSEAASISQNISEIPGVEHLDAATKQALLVKVLNEEFSKHADVGAHEIVSKLSTSMIALGADSQMATQLAETLAQAIVKHRTKSSSPQIPAPEPALPQVMEQTIPETNIPGLGTSLSSENVPSFLRTSNYQPLSDTNNSLNQSGPAVPGQQSTTIVSDEQKRELQSILAKIGILPAPGPSAVSQPDNTPTTWTGTTSEYQQWTGTPAQSQQWTGMQSQSPSQPLQLTGASPQQWTDAQSQLQPHHWAVASTQPQQSTGLSYETQQWTGASNEPQQWTGTPSQPQQWTGASTQPQQLTGTPSQPQQWTGASTQSQQLTGTPSQPQQWTGASTQPQQLTGSQSQSQQWTGSSTQPQQLTGSQSQSQQWTGSSTQPQQLTGLQSQSQQWTGSSTQPQQFSGLHSQSQQWTGSSPQPEQWAVSQSQAAQWSGTIYTSTNTVSSSTPHPVSAPTTQPIHPPRSQQSGLPYSSHSVTSQWTGSSSKETIMTQSTIQKQPVHTSSHKSGSQHKRTGSHSQPSVSVAPSAVAPSSVRQGQQSGANNSQHSKSQPPLPGQQKKELPKVIPGTVVTQNLLDSIRQQTELLKEKIKSSLSNSGSKTVANSPVQSKPPPVMPTSQPQTTSSQNSNPSPYSTQYYKQNYKAPPPNSAPPTSVEESCQNPYNNESSGHPSNAPRRSLLSTPPGPNAPPTPHFDDLDLRPNPNRPPLPRNPPPGAPPSNDPDHPSISNRPPPPRNAPPRQTLLANPEQEFPTNNLPPFRRKH